MSVFSVLLNLFLAFVGWGSVYAVLCDGLGEVSTQQHLVHILFASVTTYFTLDLLHMIFTRSKYLLEYTPHHLIGIICCCLTHFIWTEVRMMVVAYFIFEVSTPLLNICKHYIRLKRPNLPFNLAFFFTFFVSRILFGSYLTVSSLLLIHSKVGKYNQHDSSGVLYILAVLPLGLQTMNYVWFYKLTKKIYEDVSTKSKKE